MSIVKTKNGFPLVKTYLELTNDEGKRVVVDNTAVFGFVELDEGTCLLDKDLVESFEVKETIEEIGKQICLEKIEDRVWFLLGYALQDIMQKKDKDFFKRMQEEYTELYLKTLKLKQFITTDNYKKLEVEQRKLLNDQLKAMTIYLSVLLKRINLVKEENKNK